MYPAGKVAISWPPGSPNVTILSTSSVRMLVHYVVKYSRPPDIKSSSNVSLPFAWITSPETDPSLQWPLSMTSNFTFQSSFQSNCWYSFTDYSSRSNGPSSTDNILFKCTIVQKYKRLSFIAYMTSSNQPFPLALSQTKSLQKSPTAGDFCQKGVKIWAGFGQIGSTEKKWSWPIMRNFSGCFFMFSGAKRT